MPSAGFHFSTDRRLFYGAVISRKVYWGGRSPKEHEAMYRSAGTMTITIALLASSIVCATLPITSASAADLPPRWAYPENNSNYKPPADDGNSVRVPNSTAGYTWT